MDLAALLDRIAGDVSADIGRGAVADYIPALARVAPRRFGMAVAEVDGSLHGTGDWEQPFSLQSMSKVFTLALALSHGEGVWARVGREPSGNPFNSLVQLENEDGIPRNPFINAGALVVTDELARHGDAADALLGFLRAECGRADIHVDPEVAASEAAHADRNRALAYFMASYGNMRHPVPSVLDQYVRQCSIAMSCADVARSALFLARHGVRDDGTRLLDSSAAKRINAVMLTCGTYDAAGEFAYRVGLPGKSGVGGGIVAIVPGRCAVCVWSPGLDARGNSVAGVSALDRFTTLTGWSVF
ncbi:glutaminase [Amycolatopsis australiensis]|uniref:Glutaminase n=1 Tax=Amycolatopsis australiensis TaxID=546364 RepID=A0A1K1SG11_9PSEU|nr:glutaminase [Amycolatopsis australiensis]SFW82845.1 L-glutaminase [Amycolatopsis australiensis]